ncbi:MAG TPA: hypothetical protein VMT87_00110 [Vicinamibacteria bacterium]|nr:hypothetical protein [Vicinamibacteria bacterium]
MQVGFTGRQTDVPPRLRAAAESRLRNLSRRLRESGRPSLVEREA